MLSQIGIDRLHRWQNRCEKQEGHCIENSCKEMARTEPRRQGNAIHVFGGAAETIPCPYGEPFADLPTSFILAAPTASGKTMLILNLLLRY